MRITVLLLVGTFVGCALAAPASRQAAIDACVKEQTELYGQLELPKQLASLLEVIRGDHPNRKISQMEPELLENYSVPMAECDDISEKLAKIYYETPICKQLDEDELDDVAEIVLVDQHNEQVLAAGRTCYAVVTRNLVAQ